jgi:hypothetical protein
MENAEATDVKTEWPINAMDSKENAARVEEHMRQKFPKMSCKIVSDPAEIEKIINRPPPKDQVLIQIVPPLGKWMDVLSTWTDSRQESQDRR